VPTHGSTGCSFLTEVVEAEGAIMTDGVRVTIVLVDRLTFLSLKYIAHLSRCH